MAEHQELVAEMPILEQMGTQERQKLAKKRRLQQLKKWGQREKEWIAKEKQLNKRLANMLHEENNGLNLKHYTTYSSNHRSKKKLQLTSGANNNNNNNNANANNNNNIINGTQNGKNNYYNNNISKTNNYLSSKPDSGLAPNGRVHFNVGVMLLEAAARNDFDEVKRFLMLGVSPDSVNHDGLTALHQCCIDASEPIMNLLLEFGANVDAKDTEQWTPLHAACTCGHLNLVKILVENGANLLAVNGDGNMPFDICEDEATLDYIETQMVKRGITQDMIDFTRASTEMQMISDLEKQVAEGHDLNMANDSGVTQLHIAAANGYTSVVKFLLKHGVNVNVCDNDLWRPLHGAACWGNDQHAKVIELLVEAGAHLNAKTINDETVFDLCDNAELLEKLNQLKDELESKQASGTDKLRWTQSRTNSRVHSVRRTSVRDKNQISRREAREEALLRVENSAATANTDTTQISNGGKSSIANSKIDTVEITKVNGEAIKVSSSEGSNSSLSNPAPPPPPPPLTTTLVTSIADQASATSKGDKISSPFNQDPCKPAECDKATGKEASCRLSQNSTDKSTAELPRQQQSTECIDEMAASNGQQQVAQLTESNKAHIEDSNKQSQQRTKTASAISPQVTRTIINVDKNVNSSVSQAKAAALPTERATNSSSQLSNNDTACDQSSQQKQQAIVQATMVHLTPINYTLSNLKKQRSDLRMRTTSIGGNSTISSNGTSATTTISNETNNQILLNPQPTSLASDALNRPESPSLTFRKFRGEPSEAIGVRERNIRHKCCILI